MSEISNVIFDYVKTKRYVSFVEIENIFLKSGFEYRGNLAILHPSISNVVVWIGWNQEAVDVIKEVVDMGVHYVPTAVLTYLIDGKVLDLPVARARKDFKKVHWVPVTLDCDR